MADCFIPRLESVPGLAEALVPGACVALVPAASAAVAAAAPSRRPSSGKTQLAVQLAESLWRARELNVLVWITASSRDAVISGYASAAVAALGADPTADAESLATRFAGWLAEAGRPWLVVLDDLAGAAEVEGLWPAGPAGRTLVTTSDPASVAGHQQIRVFGVGDLSRREALGYLHGRLTEDRGKRTGAIDLVDRFGGELLALAQASAVIERSSLACRDYLDHFARKRVQLGIGEPSGIPPAAITWTLCVEQAYRLIPGGSVQLLLALGAMLDGNGIPGTVFTTQAVHDYAAGTSRDPATPGSAWAAITSLEQAGLLTVDSACVPPAVRICSEVQAAVRSTTARDLLDRAALVAAEALLEAWPDQDRRAWPQEAFRSCAQVIRRRTGDLLWRGSTYRLLFRIGQSMEGARLTRLAAAHWIEVADASAHYLGFDHPDALAASDRIAATFLDAGRAPEGLPWFERVVAERTRQLGPRHPATTAAMVSLGRALLAAGQPERAVSALEPAVIQSAAASGSDAQESLDAREALATAYCAAGNAADGIRAHQRAVPLARFRIFSGSQPQNWP